MDLHQIGTGVQDIGSGNYAQQEQEQQKQSSSTSSSTSSSSVSPSTRQHPQHFQQHQLYNILPPQPNSSYSPIISSESWPRSRDLQQQQQQQQYQPQQSNIKWEIMGKHLDTSNGSKNVDDSMPSTSDFVKKLYKFMLVSFFILFEYRFFFFLSIGFLYDCVGCWKILPFRISYLGDRWVIVLL